MQKDFDDSENLKWMLYKLREKKVKKFFLYIYYNYIIFKFLKKFKKNIIK